MTETDKSEDITITNDRMGGIAVLPKTDKRPLAIVGMDDGEIEQLKTLSERLASLGMEHVILTLEEAELEGITKEDLVSAQLQQKQIDGLTHPDSPFTRDTGNGVRVKSGGGSKAQQRFKRKKKGKKTHRKKKR